MHYVKVVVVVVTAAPAANFFKIIFKFLKTSDKR